MTHSLYFYYIGIVVVYIAGVQRSKREERAREINWLKRRRKKIVFLKISISISIFFSFNFLFSQTINVNDFTSFEMEINY